MFKIKPFYFEALTHINVYIRTQYIHMLIHITTTSKTIFYKITYNSKGMNCDFNV